MGQAATHGAEMLRNTMLGCIGDTALAHRQVLSLSRIRAWGHACWCAALFAESYQNAKRRREEETKRRGSIVVGVVRREFSSSRGSVALPGSVCVGLLTALPRNEDEVCLRQAAHSTGSLHRLIASAHCFGSQHRPAASALRPAASAHSVGSQHVGSQHVLCSSREPLTHAPSASVRLLFRAASRAEQS